MISAATADHLQEAYAANRAAQRRQFEQLAADGAFRAPDHLQPGLQAELGLGEPLRLDEARAEAG